LWSDNLRVLAVTNVSAGHRVIAVAFGLLAIYIAVQATVILVTGSHPTSLNERSRLALTVAAILALAAAAPQGRVSVQGPRRRRPPLRARVSGPVR
jgi:hypothetical protein